MEKIKVFLADPQVLFREGIHFILSGEEDFEVIGETTGNEEALSLIENNPPHVAILSMDDIKAYGADITSRIRRNLPSVYVMLTMEKKEPEKIFEAMKSGASSCLAKDSNPEQLVNVIKIVAQGRMPIIDELFNPAIASLVADEFEDSVALNERFDNLLASLTTREKQILNFIASGVKIEQITAKTDLTEETINQSMRIVLTKLIANVRTRQIIQAAQRSIPTVVRSSQFSGGAQDYITREEFNEFKDFFMECIKSLIGDLSPETKVKQ